MIGRLFNHSSITHDNVLQGASTISQQVFSSRDLKKLNFTPLNPKMMDSQAVRITTRLQEAGHTAYIVGGCIRDLLLGKRPKDYDVATTARPRQVKRLIKNSYIIGRRFRLVLAKHNEDQYEISTFRRNPKPHEQQEDPTLADNLFGSPKEDAFRRDYTCNALFYDPIKNIVVDHTGGLRDLSSGWIRLIGEPHVRLPEDPIRILRAIRFSLKLGLQLEPQLKKGLSQFGEELSFPPLPRRREEYLKLLRLKHPSLAFNQLFDLNLIESILPGLVLLLDTPTKRLIFSKHIDAVPYEAKFDFEPVDLLGLLVWALAKSQDLELEVFYEWLNSDNLQEFLRFELGAFNNEITQIEQAFKILPEFIELEKFKSRGERRQFGLLSQKAFPLALLLYSHEEHPFYLHDWVKHYECMADIDMKEWTLSSSDEKNKKTKEPQGGTK